MAAPSLWRRRFRFAFYVRFDIETILAMFILNVESQCRTAIGNLDSKKYFFKNFIDMCVSDRFMFVEQKAQFVRRASIIAEAGV